MKNDFLSSACSSGGCASCSSCGPVERKDEDPKPLGKITAILAGLGLEVSYAYDDLVFVQQSTFLVQFTDEPKTLLLFTNSECNPAEVNRLASNMVLAFHTADFVLSPSGKYTLSKNNDSTLDLRFS